MKLPSLLPGELVATNLESGRWSMTTWVCSTPHTVVWFLHFLAAPMHVFLWTTCKWFSDAFHILSPCAHTPGSCWPWNPYATCILMVCLMFFAPLLKNYYTFEHLFWSPYVPTHWDLSWGLIVVGIFQLFVTNWNAKALSYNKVL